jgi:hypothetical protein
MLTLSDSVVLPPGVRLAGDAIEDDVRAASFPVNETGSLVLVRHGGRLGEAAESLARRHGVDAANVADDVLRFAQALNTALLANVRPGDARRRRVLAWLALAARLAPAGALPFAVARRHPLPTGSPVRAVLCTARALAARSVLVAAAAAAAIGPAAADPGVVGLCLGLGASLVIHEAAHAVALSGMDAALVTRGVRTFVIHRVLEPRRRRLVAAAGPAAAAATGALAVVAAWLVAAPELALVGCPAAAHAVGLTVATGDGRAACGL